MDRRAFLGTMASGLLAAPLAVEAQQAGRVTHIGFLSPSSLSDPRTRTFVEAFRQGLRELGWVEDQNMTIEYRWAEEKTDRLPDLWTAASLNAASRLLALSPPRPCWP